MMYTARYLGVEGFGILSFALALTAIFSVLLDFGLNTLLVRDVSRDKSMTSQYFGNVAIMKIFFALITFGIIYILLDFSQYTEQTVMVVYFITISMIIGAFTGTLYSIFQAHEKMEYQSAGQILNSILLLLGVFFAISQKFDVVGFAVIYIFSAIVIFGYAIGIYFWGFSISSFRLDFSFCRNCIEEAWPLGVMAICTILRLKINTVMLYSQYGDVAVGFFTAASRLLDLSVTIPSMLMVAAFPIMAQYYHSSLSSFNAFYKRLFKYLFSLALPIGLATTVLAVPIINLIYGPEFKSSADVLRLMCWVATTMYVSMLAGAVFTTSNKQRASMILTIISVAYSIPLYFLLIRAMSYTGAALGLLLTEIIGLLMGIYVLNGYGHKLEIRKVCSVPLCSLLISGLVALFLIKINVNLFVITLISLIIYGVVLILFGFDREDRQFIKDIMSLKFSY